MATKLRFACGVLMACLISPGSPSLKADAPNNTFKKADGRMYCEAPHAASGCHASGRLTVTLDPGMALDRSYHQGSIPCCGGDENGNGSNTELPPGVYMEFAGGRDGEWGVFNVRLVADESSVDDNGFVRAWTITADVYCGPSAAFGKGGCNVNGYGWVKQRPLR